MSIKQETCSIDIEDSSDIRFGNIHSDADKVLKVRNVHGLNTGDIFHFTKSDQELDQIFQIIKTMVETSYVEKDVQNRALELSQNVKTSYQLKNSTSFQAAYTQFVGFLSNHVGLYTFIEPMLQKLF